MRGRLRTLVLVILTLAALAANCNPLKTIKIVLPKVGSLSDDVVVADVRVGANFDATSVEVRLDGVDLIAALALTPPFNAEAGSVMIGPDLVSISDFSFQVGGGPHLIDLVIGDLPAALHDLEIEGFKPNPGAFQSLSRAFEVVGAFALRASVTDAAGLPGGPADAGAEGVLAHASFGQPLLTPPAALPSGDESRSGFTELAESLIEGGSP